VGGWPFPQGPPTDDLWDDLLVGGKDGLFVVVMTLAWWSIKYEDTEDEPSQLKAAILDVSWVLSNILSALKTKDYTSRPASPPLQSPPPTYHSQATHKVGRPNKRRRLPQS